MRIAIAVSSFYDWEPVEPDVEVTEADVKANRVKPAADGSWHIRVTKDVASQTDVSLPEHELVALMIQDSIRDKSAHSRSEALAHYLARHVLPHNAHRKWITDVQVSDEGPNEELFEELVRPHVFAGNISEADAESMREAYLTPLTDADHVEHLRTYFKVPKEAR